MQNLENESGFKMEKITHVIKMPETAIGFFVHVAKKFKISCILACIGCCAIALENTMFPYVAKLIIDGISSYQTGSIFVHLKLAIISLIVFWFGVDILWRLAGFSIAYFRASAEAYIKEVINLTFLQQGSSFFAKYQSGDLFGRTLHTASEIPFLFEHVLYFVLPCFLNIIGVLFAAAFVEKSISIAVFAWIVLHCSVAYFFFRKNLLLSAKYAKSSNAFHGAIKDSLSNNQSVRIFNGFTTERRIFRLFASRQKRSQKDMLYLYQHMLLIMSVLSFIFNGVLTIVLLIIALRAGRISIGEVAMIFYLVKNLSAIVFETTIVLGEIIQTYGVIKKNYSFAKDIDYLTKKERKKDFKIGNGSVKMENVDFSYESEESVFSGFNLDIKPGQKVGVVGKSGSGKSTLIGLLTRDLLASSGKILIDGEDISEYSQPQVARHVSYVPQSTILFNRTIFDNIRYAKPHAGYGEVVRAAIAVGIHDEIMKMPNQYETYVGELGSEISGGQRQKIAIARAMLCDASILIFDEATSALDIEAELLIKDLIQDSAKDKTTIVIAHRLASVSFLDRIIVMQEGRVIEDGSPEELLAKEDGVYRKMIDANVEGLD